MKISSGKTKAVKTNKKVVGYKLKFQGRSTRYEDLLHGRGHNKLRRCYVWYTEEEGCHVLYSIVQRKNRLA